MKKLLLVPLAFTLLLAACAKEEVPASQPVKVKTNTVHSSSRLLPHHDYTLYKDELRDQFWCGSPKDDCAKMGPWGDDISFFSPIDNAIANGTVKDFFNTSGWQDRFPCLDDQPEVVHGLQTGDYTMIRRASDNDVFYIVLNATDDPNNFARSVYTTDVYLQ